MCVRFAKSIAATLAALTIPQTVFACGMIAGTPTEIVNESTLIFWGMPIKAQLVDEASGDLGKAPQSELHNGVVEFRVELAVKGVRDGELISARFPATGSSCDLMVTVGRNGMYFLQSWNGEYYWDTFTQPERWIEECSAYLDAFEAELGVSMPLLRERLSPCRKA